MVPSGGRGSAPGRAAIKVGCMRSATARLLPRAAQLSKRREKAGDCWPSLSVQVAMAIAESCFPELRSSRLSAFNKISIVRLARLSLSQMGESVTATCAGAPSWAFLTISGQTRPPKRCAIHFQSHANAMRGNLFRGMVFAFCPVTLPRFIAELSWKQ